MIVITGANGFIGSATVSELSMHNPKETIVCMDIISQEEHDLLKKKKNLIIVSFEDFWDVLETYKEEIRYVIHMGAISSTTETSWAKLKTYNVDFSKRLFTWCTKNKISLIYASSAATYGDGKLGFDEDIDLTKLKPLNLYGKSKLMFDTWVMKQKKTPPNWYGLRFFNVFGPNEYFKESMASMIYKSYFQIKKEKQIKLFKSYVDGYKDGKQQRDFVYVKDITRWMVELIKKSPKSGIYNMGYGKPKTWVDIADATFGNLTLPKKIVFIEMPEQIKKHYQYFTCANMSKWYASGMSKPKWPLKKAINDYIDNHLRGNKLY